jgi:hypothetical protein
VIAATAADDESNETEFPEALATVVKRPVERLDANGDRRVSIAELFTAVTAEVLARFAGDSRFPTEHAQLDDNGDGKGTEKLGENEGADPSKATDPKANPPVKPANAKIDGDLARQTFLPDRLPDVP